MSSPSSSFENRKSSYLMLNDYSQDEYLASIPIEMGTFDSLIWLPNYINENELVLWERRILSIRQLFPTLIEEQVIGLKDGYKYIGHQAGRYDIWDLNLNSIDEQKLTITKPNEIPSHLIQRSVGALLLDKHTITNGKWHCDAVELFPETEHTSSRWSPHNDVLPPFYYTLFIALNDLTEDNGPTQFYSQNDDVIYWVPLKKGDALLFPGHIIHRGTANFTNSNRDLIYVVYAAPWYNEEAL